MRTTKQHSRKMNKRGAVADGMWELNFGRRPSFLSTELLDDGGASPTANMGVGDGARVYVFCFLPYVNPVDPVRVPAFC
ncbi:hypothetical protein HanIR_Chr04g0160851 [Helianthus annuus]|nr:hypothetical protein HanIR_Chr04g0160851 [Helianthus annuus]